MKLIVQPDDGVAPVLTAIRKARKSVDIVVFRLDIKDVVSAIEEAVQRGVAVRALIAHTNKGGEKTLRELETRLLDAGATVSRTADDLVRYHGKMMVVDERRLYVLGFNVTWLDVRRSRSFGVVTTARPLVREALKLFEADCDRQPYSSSNAQFVVSPETSRDSLSTFIQGARKQLFIYDPDASDVRMLRLLADRAAAGVDVRILGKVGARSAVKAQKLPGRRLHVRAIIRDGRQAFIGSQSLRAIELDRRREIGVIVRDRTTARRMATVFEDDWATTQAGEGVAGTDKSDKAGEKDDADADEAEVGSPAA